MKDFKIHFLNTVWSDSILLESEGHFGLVDTASKFYYPMIQEYFQKLNISSLDFVILTHFHSDHYGNLASILNDVKVDTLYIKTYSGHEGTTGTGSMSNEEYLAHEKMMFDSIMLASKNANHVVILDNQTSPYIVNFNGIDLELYNTINVLNKAFEDENSPFYHQHILSENYNSVPIYIDINGHKIFLGSDVMNNPSSYELSNFMCDRLVNEIYARHNINHFDVFKSCHHGGGGTNKIELLKLINCSYCIITNTSKWLDIWTTIPNLKEVNEDVVVLTTDHHQHILDFSSKNIRVKSIAKESLFLELNKN